MSRLANLVRFVVNHTEVRNLDKNMFNRLSTLDFIIKKDDETICDSYLKQLGIIYPTLKRSEELE